MAKFFFFFTFSSLYNFTHNEPLLFELFDKYLPDGDPLIFDCDILRNPPPVGQWALHFMVFEQAEKGSKRHEKS